MCVHGSNKTKVCRLKSSQETNSHSLISIDVRTHIRVHADASSPSPVSSIVCHCPKFGILQRVTFHGVSGESPGNITTPKPYNLKPDKLSPSTPLVGIGPSHARGGKTDRKLQSYGSESKPADARMSLSSGSRFCWHPESCYYHPDWRYSV